MKTSLLGSVPIYRRFAFPRLARSNNFEHDLPEFPCRNARSIRQTSWHVDGDDDLILANNWHHFCSL